MSATPKTGCAAWPGNADRRRRPQRTWTLQMDRDALLAENEANAQALAEATAAMEKEQERKFWKKNGSRHWSLESRKS